MCQLQLQNFTYTTSGNSCKILTSSSHTLSSVAEHFQEWMTPIFPRSNCFPGFLSTWSVRATGNPSISGNMPYKSPHSLSCRLSHDAFWRTKSGRSCKVFGNGLSAALEHYVCCSLETLIYPSQTHWHTDTQTDTHTHRTTDTQTHRHTDTHTHTLTYIHIYIY